MCHYSFDNKKHCGRSAFTLFFTLISVSTIMTLGGLS